MASKEDFAATDRVLEKIGDHYNNPEMSDRILIVKVRPLGWQIREAAKLAQNVRKTAYVKEEHTEKTSTQLNATDESCPVPRVDKKSSGSLENVFQNTESIENQEIFYGMDTNTDSCENPAKPTTQNSKFGTKRRKNHSLDSSFLGEEANAQSLEVAAEAEALENENVLKLVENDDIFLEEKVKIVKTDEGILVVDCEKEDEIIQADKRVCIEDQIETENMASADDVDSYVVCEHEMYVHSFWLALNSPFFRGLFFSSGMKETKDNKVHDTIHAIQ